ncbi:MAG: 30S ribosome-binding factor RbfA [Chloroflexi bacterium]|nr:30S ribosome-binding factor RbfA [Chloroflexota bacterium]
MARRGILRLNEQIRDTLAELLQREMRDPRLSGVISITGVETAPDLTVSKVYVSVLGSEAEAADALRALRRAAGYLRRELGTRLRTRRLPTLEFHLDTSIARGARVLSLLREIEQAPAADEQPPAPPPQDPV